MSREREPTGDELLAMAYADGELAGDARLAFEARLAREPDLRREVAELQGLAVLARQLAPAEPAELEWQSLAAGWQQRAGTQVGLGLALAGALLLAAGLLGWILWSTLPVALKAGAAAIGLGLAVLLLVALRARRRLAPLDPYTKVKR